MKAPPTHRSTDVVAAMRRTVGALFCSLDGNFATWSTVIGSQPVPTLGTPSEAVLEPVQLSRKRLRDMFATGVTQLEPVFKSILSFSTLSELQRIASLEVRNFNYPAELWVKTVLEFAAAYHRSVINRDHIIQAMVPLYRGRSLAFFMENRNGSGKDIDNSVEALCGEFERLKPYLLEIWANGK
jgi:hypothetical protein